MVADLPATAASARYRGPATRSAAAEVASAIFLRPASAYLVRVWQFAGPSCCIKASALARGAGPVEKPGKTGLLGERSSLPWEEWWPTLGRGTLINLLLRPPSKSDAAFNLDRAWAAIRARPEIVNTPVPEGRLIVVALQRGHRYIAELLRCSGATLSGRLADELLYESASRGAAAPISVLLCDAQGARRPQPWACANARPTRHGGTPLDAAVNRGHAECAELLRRAGGRHSLHWAAKHAVLSDVTAWLSDGACVDERDGSGATPLWHAVRGVGAAAVVPWEGAVEIPRDQCVAMLLEAGASVDVLPITMETPLHIAAANGEIGRCQQLLEARADPTVADREGRTPLQHATDPAVCALLSRNAAAATAAAAALDIDMPFAPNPTLSHGGGGAVKRRGGRGCGRMMAGGRGVVGRGFREPEDGCMQQDNGWQMGWPYERGDALPAFGAFLAPVPWLGPAGDAPSAAAAAACQWTGNGHVSWATPPWQAPAWLGAAAAATQLFEGNGGVAQERPMVRAAWQHQR